MYVAAVLTVSDNCRNITGTKMLLMNMLKRG